MELIYCSKCGKMIPPGGLDDGKRYVKGEENICPKCYKQVPEEEHSGKTMMEKDGVAPVPASREPTQPDFDPKPPTSRLSMPAAKRLKSSRKAGAKAGSGEGMSAAAPAGSGRTALWWGGAAVLAAGAFMAVILSRGPRGPEPGPGIPMPPEAGGTALPQPGPAPSDDKKLGEMHELASSFWKQNPEDYAGAAARFDKVRKAGAGTRRETLADEAIEQVNAARAKAAETEFGRLKDEGRRLAEAGDYEGALEALGKFPEKFADLLAPKLETERKALRSEAEERLGAALAAAEKLSADGQPEQGLAELDKVKSVKYAALAGKFAELSARLQKESADAAGKLARQHEAEARKLLEPILARYEELLLAGKWAEAAGHVAAESRKLGKDAAEIVTAALGSAGRVAEQIVAYRAARQKGLGTLVGKDVELQTRAEGPIKGAIEEVAAEDFKIKVTFRIGGTERTRVRAVPFADLAPGELDRLVPWLRLEGADSQLAAAVMAMGVRDVAGAEKALAAAGTHPLAGRWTKRLDVLKLGAAEAAAKEAWERDVGRLVREKYSAEEGKAMLAALDAYVGTHGRTQFAKGLAEEAGKLRAAAQLPLGPVVYDQWPFDAAEAKRRQKATAAALGLPVEQSLDLGGGVKLELVLIPPGEFVMGGKDSAEEILRRGGGERAWYEREQGQHRVRITKPFYLGKYEVTREQWEKVMGASPDAPGDGRQHPFDWVNYGDCQKFVRKLDGVFKGKAEFRLPTEAEWEYACRAGTETSFYTGENLSTDQANYNGDYAWDGKKGKNIGKAVAVGSYPANPWGLYDMAGNVWEWCLDWYDEYPKKPQVDPQGAAQGSDRVLRGGSWYDMPATCRSSYRFRYDRNSIGGIAGLRVLAVMPAPEHR